MATKGDGTVWSWGWNDYGQLGDGTQISRSVPIQVVGLTQVATAAGGSAHSLAVKEDGTVWAWGMNRLGVLGNGTLSNSLIPVQTLGLSHACDVAAGSVFSHALTSDGTVWAWGNETPFRARAPRPVPTQIASLEGVIALAAGAFHTLALREDGTVWAWGLNNHGQLGNGEAGELLAETMPVQVKGLTDVVAIASRSFQGIAIRGDGTVWAWGRNYDGQLGSEPSGYGTYKATPARVVGLGDGVIAVSAGDLHSLALKEDGTIWAWGNGSLGRLGNGKESDSLTPVQVLGLANVVAIASGDGHSLALGSDGVIWAWGANGDGQLGDGTAGYRAYKTTPVRVVGLTL